jgi:Fe-S oxidoreductase
MAPRRSKSRSRKNLRSFTEVKNDGRYISKDPVSAAKKAARQLIKRSSRSVARKGKVISVRETTNGSAKKVYTYKVKKVKVKSPVVVERKDGTSTIYKYKMVAKSMN